MHRGPRGVCLVAPDVLRERLKAANEVYQRVKDMPPLTEIEEEPDDNNRRIKYTKESGKTDDLVHALAYAQEVAVLAAQRAIRYGIM